MARPGVGNFKYHVGISSLAQIATREDPEFLRLRRELYDFIKSAER